MKIFTVTARERPTSIRSGSARAACCAGVFGAASGTIASIDTQCWPVIEEMSSSQASPAWWPVAGDHWRSLDDVRRLVRGVESRAPDGRREIWIVVGAFVCPGPRSLDDWTSTFLPCEPRHPGAAWPLLGFDVVDSSLQSLLHGAGEYEPTAGLTRSGVLDRARRSLNSVGLVGDADTAAQLADVASEVFRNNASSLEACAVFVVPRSAR